MAIRDDGRRSQQEKLTWPRPRRVEGEQFNVSVLLNQRGASQPLTLRISLAGKEHVRLEWNGQAVLQTASEVTGPWEGVPDAQSPSTTPVSGDHRFFRLLER